MRLSDQQRCDRCEGRRRPGCLEWQRALRETRRAVCAAEERARIGGARLPATQVTFWCDEWWREGRRHG